LNFNWFVEWNMRTASRTISSMLESIVDAQDRNVEVGRAGSTPPSK
jgi:hypothetical protein